MWKHGLRSIGVIGRRRKMTAEMRRIRREMWVMVGYRDSTWRYIGAYYVGIGPERSFDKSWMTLIPLVAEWLAELKHDLDRSDV